MNGDGEELCCAETAHCKIRPRWDYTPVWQEFSPAILYPGQKTSLFITPYYVEVNQLEGTFLHYIDIRLDDTELNIIPYMDSESGQGSIRGWKTSTQIEGDVKTNVRTLDSNVSVYFHGTGYAFNAGR